MRLKVSGLEAYRLIHHLLIQSVAHLTAIWVPDDQVPDANRTAGVGSAHYMAVGLMKDRRAPRLLTAYHL